MKKVLLTAVALAAISNVASAKGFNGTYAGAKASYMFASKAKYSATNANPTGQDVTLKNWEGDIIGGQYFQAGDWIWAVEGNLGHGATKSKSTAQSTLSGTQRDININTSRSWKVGVAGRLGQTVSDCVLLYGRLGLQGSQFQSKINVGHAPGQAPYAQSKSMNFFSWAVTPGVGVEYAFADNLNARLEYTYELSLNKKSASVAGSQYSIKAPQISTVAVGLTYSF
jgi:outer membrane immunogenic protein